MFTRVCAVHQRQCGMATFSFHRVQLPTLGINPNSITFANLTMESEKFICVREEGKQVNIVIIDLANPQGLMRKPITADSAIMNPTEKLLALRGSTSLASDSDYVRQETILVSLHVSHTLFCTISITESVSMQRGSLSRSSTSISGRK